MSGPFFPHVAHTSLWYWRKRLMGKKQTTHGQTTGKKEMEIRFFYYEYVLYMMCMYIYIQQYYYNTTYKTSYY